MLLRLLVLAAAFIVLPAFAAEEPEAVYAKFHNALMTGNFTEMNKYGTPGGADQLAKLPPEKQKAIFDLMKNLMPSTYTIAGKEVSPDGSKVRMRATGMVTGLLSDKPMPTHGDILMVKMGGEWKVDESNWNTKPPAQAKAAPAPAPQKAARAATPGTPAPRMQPLQTQAAPAAPAKPAGECVYKPVMTDEDIARCR